MQTQMTVTQVSQTITVYFTFFKTYSLWGLNYLTMVKRWFILLPCLIIDKLLMRLVIVGARVICLIRSRACNSMSPVVYFLAYGKHGTTNNHCEPLR